MVVEDNANSCESLCYDHRYVTMTKELKAIKKEHNSTIAEITELKTELAELRQQAGEADRLMHGLVAANEK